jgi:hypothetical protein
MSAGHDVSWQRFVDHNKLVLDGRPHRIEAEALRTQTGCEPRLLARYDSPDDLPRCLREAGYSILPLRHGEYLLAPGELCCAVPSCRRTEPWTTHLPFALETAARGEGEAQWIDHAFNTGLLAHFVAVEPLYLTIRGRERTGSFAFRLGDARVEVSGVQIEVDAGYEGAGAVVLVEAKMGRPRHINVRQLYYPWRHFGQLAPHKAIRTVLLTYDVGSTRYELHEFAFADAEDPTSWRVVRSVGYRLYEPDQRRLDELLGERRPRTSMVPQADDFNRLLRVLEVLDAGLERPDAVAGEVGFSARQAEYYREAGEFLGLVQPNTTWLSPAGRELLRASPQRRRELLARAVVNSWLVRDLLASGEPITRARLHAAVAALVRRDGQPRYSGSTVVRRARTLESWLRWLADEVGCFRREGGTYLPG